jgi:hypothetical protein
MHVSTLQCAHLLWLDRYLEDFQAFAVTCYTCKLNCFNDTLSQISQISKFSAVNNVLNKPPCTKSSTSTEMFIVTAARTLNLTNHKI